MNLSVPVCCWGTDPFLLGDHISLDRGTLQVVFSNGVYKLERGITMGWKVIEQRPG